MVFGYQDENNFYRLVLNESKENKVSNRKIERISEGVVASLYERNTENAIPDDWFSLTAIIKNDSLLTFVNGELFSTVNFVKNGYGDVGVISIGKGNLEYDSVSVTRGFNVYSAPAPFSGFVDRQPYIQNSTKNSVAIAWMTKEPSLGSVTVIKDSIALTFNEEFKTNRHYVELNNLDQGSKYSYKVLNDTVLFADSLEFSTFPEDSKDTLSFIVWGDSGTLTNNQIAMNSIINEQKSSIDFALHVGDVSQFNGEEYDQVYFSAYAPLIASKQVYTVIGNHDTYHNNAQTYLNDFYMDNGSSNSERYYSFRHGKAFFIALDTNIDFEPGSEQYAFLLSQLQSPERLDCDWTIVFFHHPPYCELWTGWSGELNVRRHIMPLMEKHKVDVVFNGHTHGYEHGKTGGVHYVITGGGGGNLDVYARDVMYITKSKSVYHYSKVVINGNKLEIYAIDSKGSILDQFSIEKESVVASNKQNEEILREEAD